MYIYAFLVISWSSDVCICSFYKSRACDPVMGVFASSVLSWSCETMAASVRSRSCVFCDPCLRNLHCMTTHNTQPIAANSIPIPASSIEYGNFIFALYIAAKFALAFEVRPIITLSNNTTKKRRKKKDFVIKNE